MPLNKAHDYSMVNPDGERSLYEVQDRTIIIVPASDWLIIMGNLMYKVVLDVATVGPSTWVWLPTSPLSIVRKNSTWLFFSN